MPRATSLSREDWIVAALNAMGERGLAGVAVEPLAKLLGATKGSFYWHFKDRDDLLVAALKHWEGASTEAVIAKLGPLEDPHARLQQLLEALFVGSPSSPQGVRLRSSAKYKSIDLSIALLGDTWRHPAAARIVTRVTKRRIAYIAEQLEGIGVPAEEAQHRALLAYTSYIGFSTLSRGAKGSVPRGSAGRSFVATLMRVLTRSE